MNAVATPYALAKHIRIPLQIGQMDIRKTEALLDCGCAHTINMAESATMSYRMFWKNP